MELELTICSIDFQVESTKYLFKSFSELSKCKAKIWYLGRKGQIYKKKLECQKLEMSG